MDYEVWLEAGFWTLTIIGGTAGLFALLGAIAEFLQFIIRKWS